MNSQNNSCPVCETTLTGFYPPNKYDCPRCGEFILTGSLQAELPGKLAGGIHRRALMSHKLRRMARDGQPPRKISTYTVDSFWTDEVMPTPTKQADDLILWVGNNQLSPDYPTRAALYFLGAWVGTSQPGPNIINGRPVTIGSNGRPLDDGPQTSCGYGQALFSLIETTASRLDPKSFANQAEAKNAVIAAVSDEYNRRKATRDWFGFNWKQTVFTPGHMLASVFDADLTRQCFPRFAKLLNDMVLVQQQRQVQEAKVRAEREAAEAQRKAEHQAKMAEIERQQAEERRAREAAEAQQRAEAAAQMAVIEQKRLAEKRQRDEAEAKARAERAAQEAKERAEHEAKMAEIERERQAEVARAAAERAEQWRSSVEAAWKVPFLLNTNISEDLFKAVKNEVGFACGRKIRNLVKYDIRSPGTFYGTNSGDSALLRFTQWQVRVSKTGTMTIWGDDAEAQNGFGTWLKVNYSCEVDLASKKIINVSIDQGRLPDPTN